MIQWAGINRGTVLEEARRFLRYIFPGFAFAIELWLLLTLSCNRLSLFCVLNRLQYQLPYGVDVSSLGVAVSSVLILGGLGYLFSIVHHVLLWSVYAYLTKWFRRWSKSWEKLSKLQLTPDYRELFRAKDSEISGLDSTRGPWANGLKVGEEVGLADAWRKVTAYWYGNLDCPKLKEATRRTQDLTDISHGAGTTLVGAVAAIFIWVVVVCTSDHFGFLDLSFCRTAAVGLVVLILLVMHFFSYVVTVNHATSVIQKILWERGTPETSAPPKPPATAKG